MVDILIDPGGEPANGEIFVWMAVQPDGTEGIAAMLTDTGWMPLLGQRRQLAIDKMGDVVRTKLRPASAAAGITYELRRYVLAEVLPG